MGNSYFLTKKNLFFVDNTLESFSLIKIASTKKIFVNDIKISEICLYEMCQRIGGINSFYYKFCIKSKFEYLEFFADIISTEALLNTINKKPITKSSHYIAKFYSINSYQNMMEIIDSDNKKINYLKFIQNNSDSAVYVYTNIDPFLQYYPYIFVVFVILFSLMNSNKEELAIAFSVIFIVGIFFGGVLRDIPIYITHYKLKKSLEVIGGNSIDFVSLKKYKRNVFFNFLIVALIMVLIFYLK